MNTPQRHAMTVKEVAAASGFSVDAVEQWILDGKIPAFCTPGRRIGDGKRGRKGTRIWSDDWERFRRANTFIEPTPEEKEAARVKGIAQNTPKTAVEVKNRLFARRSKSS